MKLGFRSCGIWLSVAGALLLLASAASGVDETFPVLKTRTADYTNVTVTAKNVTAIFIRHAGGVANIKIQDLEPDVLQSLGYAVATEAKKETTENPAARVADRVMESLPFKKLEAAEGEALAASLQNLQLSRSVVIGVVAGMALSYLLFCYCCVLICRKTGNDPGILVWLPVLQIFPLLRAAGMSGWWFLALFVPVLNLLAQILWCVNIVRARDKSMWWALFLILPVTNVLAFLYLAFSSSAISEEDARFSTVSPRLA